MQDWQIDEQVKHILDKIHAGVLYCKNDDYSTILYANEYFYTLVGYTKEEIERIFHNRFSEMVVEDTSAILLEVGKAVQSGEDLDFEYRIRRKDGSIIWLHDTACYDKRYDCFYVTVMDITAIKNVKYEYKKLSMYLNYMPNKIVIFDTEGKLVYKNNKARACAYFTPDMDNMNRMVESHILGMEYTDLMKRAGRGEIVEYQTRFMDANGITGHDRNYIVPILNSNGAILNYMQISEDLLAICDSLTSLPVRSMLEYYYNHLLARQALYSAFLCIVDIDNFKAINDTYGHLVGDRALKMTAERLSQLVGSKDYVCRFGGDEFVLLLVDCSWEQAARRIESLRRHTFTPVELEGNVFTMSYSIGVAPIQPDSAAFNKVLRQADKALYQVKIRGKGQMLFYNEDRRLWDSKGKTGCT